MASQMLIQVASDNGAHYKRRSIIELIRQLFYITYAKY